MPVLCQLADPDHYRTFDWDMHADPRDVTYWLDLYARFPRNIERHLRDDGLGGENFDERWRTFLDEYDAEIRILRANPKMNGPLSTLKLGDFRRSMLNKHGWPDPYLRVKQHENELAAGMYPQVVSKIDALPVGERWISLLRGLFAGNMFDLGSPKTIAMHDRGEIDYQQILKNIPSRPWFIDHADTLCARLNNQSYKQVLFFADNAGTDIVLGVVPLVREMARCGMRVVIAANSGPALNDITFAEINPLLEQLSGMDATLRQQIAGGQIATVPSGTVSPLINLSGISEECNAAAANSDLIVLEGMGRGVESNWQQLFRCDALRIALVKDEIVAKWIGGKVFDAVCRFDRGPGSG